MKILLYLAGSTLFLFGFFFFADNTDRYPSLVYLQYTSVLLVFSFLMLGIVDYTKHRTKRPTERERATDRRKVWQDRRNATRAGRRHW